MNPLDHKSNSSSPPPVDSSLPALRDSVQPSSTNALELFGEISEVIDPVEQIRPSKSFESSESMNPGHQQHGSTPSSPPPMETSGDPVPPPLVDPLLPTSGDPLPLPPKDAIQLIEEMYKSIDPEYIGRLASFIKTQLHKIKTPSEAGSSSSDSLATVQDVIELGARTIRTISTEAEKLSESYGVRDIGNMTLKVMKGVGELNSVLMGLSVAAYAIGSYTRVGSAEKDCRELLLRTLQLANDVEEYGKQIPLEKDKAIGTIMESAVICLGYLKIGNFSRLWSPATAFAQLEQTDQQLTDLRGSLEGIRIPLTDPSTQLFDSQKDVFLSHAGSQKDFVRKLHRDLTEKHISCFFDEDKRSLPLAMKFSSRIFKAAERCKIAVVVLSKDFIFKKWPMLELSAFIRARELRKKANLKVLPEVLPIFMIAPKELSDIAKNSPDWKKFVKSNDITGDWEAALNEVRAINGLCFGQGEDEEHFKDRVAIAIRDLLNLINQQPQLLDFEPVGIEEQVEKVKALLDMEGSESALAVDVCGFGGVGKSTIAASVVQSLDWSWTNFKFCRVAIDEKTPDKTSHIVKLQRDIIQDIGGKDVDVRDTQEGKCRIKEAITNKCSLLFIDNVVSIDYIRDLLPKDLWSGDQNTKVRILITSRQKNVKPELKMICKEYDVTGLSDAASERLLHEIIFLRSERAEDISLDEKRMIDEVAAACKGVPLLLSVFGKHLSVARDEDSYQMDKDSYLKEIYEEVLNVLREGNLDRYDREEEYIGKRLMFVYYKIKDEEVKEAFLDICSHFHGWEWSLVADIVDVPTLKNLEKRMLVSRSGSGEVIVHDILRLMGMNEANLTRFSDYKKLSKALDGDLEGFDVEKVKGISLVDRDLCIKIKSTQLEAMRHSLRVLMLGDWVTLEGSPCQKAFTKLRYLRMGDITVSPFKDSAKMDKLRVFHNRSMAGLNLSHLPSGLKRLSLEVPSDAEPYKFANLSFQNLRSLKSFIIKTQKSVELPEELHLPPSLVDLFLNRCKNLPRDIGHLTALESLVLDRSHLQCLPQGFGKLEKLKHLSMNYCSQLDSLSEELGKLSSLESLSMEGCQKLTALPKTLGGLRSLQTLELSKCTHLQVLPESIGKLPIQSLILHDMVKLHDLSNSFGDMPLLKYFSLESCDSLMSLPNSFVQLEMLETLRIINCTKLGVLPQDFGLLRCLKRITVAACSLLKELPHGFGALPALEELYLRNLPLISRIPDGFGKLKKLRHFNVEFCLQLKTLSDDFENNVTLEKLCLTFCPELDGAILEKILKLQNCYVAHVGGSTKLLEKWEQIKRESQHPIVVNVDLFSEGEEERKRAIRVALLHGKCMEVNNATGQLMERSSLLVGLEEGITATVALIMLAIHLQSHQHQTLQQFVEMAKERAKTHGSGKLQIVCARKVDLRDAERATVREKEGRAEEGIRQILLSLPEGSCAIPSSESKRLKILTRCCAGYTFDRSRLIVFMANVVPDIEGRKFFEKLEITEEKEKSENVIIQHPTRKTEKTHYNRIQNFIKSICPTVKGLDEQSESQSETEECIEGKSKTQEFVEALKDNGIHELLNDNATGTVAVDDLYGKTIGLIICDFRFLKWIKLQQIYIDLQQKDSNFIWIWIPTKLPGHATYTRLIQCIPWATFPHPQLVSYCFERGFAERIGNLFVVLDKHGQIANHDALPLLLGWGVKFHPFTQHTIYESFSLMESESCLEFLLHGMNIVRGKPMKSKMTFLYTGHPRHLDRMKLKLEELTQIHDSFEVFYVGPIKVDFNHNFIYNDEDMKEEYEEAIQHMRWPSLSFSDMIMFSHRCKYLAFHLPTESNVMMQSLRSLAIQLLGRDQYTSLLLVDSDGLVTRVGDKVVEMICESSDEMSMVKDELMKSFVKTVFTDKFDNHPQHPQHSIEYYPMEGIKCNACGVVYAGSPKTFVKAFRCLECGWFMCGNCWLAYANQQVEQLLRQRDY